MLGTHLISSEKKNGPASSTRVHWYLIAELPVQLWTSSGGRPGSRQGSRPGTRQPAALLRRGVTFQDTIAGNTITAIRRKHAGRQAGRARGRRAAKAGQAESAPGQINSTLVSAPDPFLHFRTWKKTLK